MSTENESGISNALESQKCRRSKPRKYRHRQKITTNIVEKRKNKFKYKEETKNEKYNNTAFSMLFPLYRCRCQLSHEKTLNKNAMANSFHNMAQPSQIRTRDLPSPSIELPLNPKIMTI
jgi:hypothetical protein